MHFKYNKIWLIFIFMALLSTTAQAHAFSSNIGGFVSGFKHPLTGLDHFLAMLSVGLWGAQIGGRSVWTLPVTFPLIMVVGGILGILGVYIPSVEVGIALSVLALGAAIALKLKPPHIVVLTLVSIFAIYHGYAHGLELPNAAKLADFALGFVISTGLIHILGIGVGLVFLRFYRGVLVQVIGSLIALFGIYFLFQAI